MAVNVVERIDDRVEVRNVLVSLSDKTGLDNIVHGLVGANGNVKIFSTGGTHRVIAEILGENGAARHLSRVSDYTGQPEMQGGLVKTLDFKIYLGILSETYNEAHADDMARTGAVNMDMVVVNLYPFEQAAAAPGATIENARANIDIGGPCMVRAAAKNFLRVASVTDPADYDGIISELGESGATLSLQTRFRLAQKAFAHTAGYDAAIAGYMAGRDFEKEKRCYKVLNP